MGKKIYAVDTVYGYRTDTLANWQAENPVLYSGEPVIVSDGKDGDWLKIGDGVTPFNDLPYKRGPQGLRGEQGEQGIQGEKGEQGIQGIQGEKGDKGDKGADGTVAFDELTEEQKESLKMGVGEKTAEGGEIFNDYETNKTLSKHTSVRGSGNQVGSKGFRITDSSQAVLQDDVYSQEKSEEIQNTAYVLDDTLLTVEIAGLTAEQRDIIANIGGFFSGSPSTTFVVLRLAFNYLLKVHSFITEGMSGMAEDGTPKYFVLLKLKSISPISEGLTAYGTTEQGNTKYKLDLKELTSAETNKYLWYNTISFVDYPTLGNVDIGLYADSKGYENKSLRVATRSSGRGNTVLGDYGSADGQGNTVGYCSHSGGRDNEILGEYCDGNGQSNKVNANSRYTRINGYGNKLSDLGNEAVNKNWDETRSDAADIHGIGNVGRGLAIFIRGLGNKVTAKFGSITGGKGNEVTAPFGRAGGLGNKVTADLGDAFGNETEAGNTAVSRGYGTKALGWLSAAFGYFTRALQRAQFVVGEYNSPKSNTLFEVGNGKSNTDRKNAFEVYKDGHAEVQTQGTTDNSVVLMQTLNNLIAFGTDNPEDANIPEGCLFYVKISE